jgi:glutathione S-transferase
MAHYKITYFNGKGRAETSRILLAITGQDFEDKRIEREEWPAIKPNTPFGQVPVLEVTENGETFQLGQSFAIARFLANRFNLAGHSDVEKARVDGIADQFNDLQTEFYATWREQDEEKKKQLLEAFLNESVPKHFAVLEKALNDNKTHSGWYVGADLTWADVHGFTLLDFLADKLAAAFEKFPLVKANYDKVKSHPKVAAWLHKRPETPF